jgi:cytochrome c oxidase cbb3-type subunit 2
MQTKADTGMPRRAPAGVLFFITIGMFAAIYLIYLWMRRDSELHAQRPSPTSAAAIPGPRVPWSSVTVPARDPNRAPDGKAGETLYAKWCVACHGEKGDGMGLLAKALDPPPRDFTKGRFRFRTTPQGSLPSDGDLYRTITAGVLPSRMPSFAFLTDTERWALVAQVKKLSAFFDNDEQKVLNYFELTPADPEESFDGVTVQTDAAAIERGRKLFVEKGECWKCHGPLGLGDGPSAPELKSEEGFPIRSAIIPRGPAWLKVVSNARDVFRVLKLGISGTPMPSYLQGIGEEGLRDLAAYTESLWLAEPPAPMDLHQTGSRQLTGTQSLYEFGARTFTANCSGCHGPAGRGDGVAAVHFKTKPASLASGIYKFKSTPEGCFPSDLDFKRTLRSGVGGSSMPSWNLHSEAELDAVVYYLKTIAGQRARHGEMLAIAQPPVARIGTPESIEKGKQVFGAMCTTCHGKDGLGDGDFATIVADYRGEKIRPRNLREEPFKYGLDGASIFRTISYGFEGSPMPGFHNALSDADRWDLVSYIQSIREVATPAR